MNKIALLLANAGSTTGDYELSFVASADGASVNFFSQATLSDFPAESFDVVINGVSTGQNFASLSFLAGDEVSIYGNDVLSFPMFYASNKNYFKTIEPLPFVADILNGLPSPINNFNATFENCTSLQSIPSDLFINNPRADFYRATFRGCTGLTTLPADLFVCTQKEGSFIFTFENCTNIRSVPENLFEMQNSATSFYGTFKGCSKLSGRIRITSPNVSSASNFCQGAGAITVVVPADSTTESTFRSVAQNLSNLTVETY